MKNSKAVAMAIVGLFAVAGMESAHAKVSTFDWTLTGPSPSLGGVPFPGSGTITATEATGGAWDLDTITGEVGGSAITGKTTFFGSDNLVFPAGTTFVDTSCIAFTTAAGQSVNIFSFFPIGTPPSGNAYGQFATNGFGVGTFTLTAVPEPSTWAMMVLGFAVLAFAGYRTSRTVASIAA
jgi:hypothetical protein